MGCPSAKPERYFEIYDFEVMLCVAELGSFRKASLRLDIGQSAVSRRIQKIEDIIGVSLFERYAGGARLTAAGACFAKRARAVISNFEEAISVARAAATGEQGNLRIGLIASLSRGVIRNTTLEFFSRHPNVEVLLVEAERSELLSLLSHRRLDAIVASGGFPPEYGDSFVLAHETIHIALPEKHLLADRQRLSWNDLRNERFVVSADEPGPEIQDYLIRQLGELGKAPYIVRHRIGREGVMNLVGLGLGISLVADHWRGVRYPNVLFRPVGCERERIPFSLVWRPENDNPALRRFVSLARVHARKAAAGDAASRNADPPS